jgi:hypothetical protein
MRIHFSGKLRFTVSVLLSGIMAKASLWAKPGLALRPERKSHSAQRVSGKRAVVLAFTSGRHARLNEESRRIRLISPSLKRPGRRCWASRGQPRKNKMFAESLGVTFPIQRREEILSPAPTACSPNYSVGEPRHVRHRQGSVNREIIKGGVAIDPWSARGVAFPKP